MRQRGIISGAKVIFATLALFATSTGSVCAEDAVSSLLTQPSLTDAPDGPEEQLQSIGIMPDVWVTQFYQGQTEAARPGVTAVSSTLSLRWMQRNLAFGQASTSMCNTSITSVKT
jgi:hypothetical protein